jgi:hypothetical protein
MKDQFSFNWFRTDAERSIYRMGDSMRVHGKSGQYKVIISRGLAEKLGISPDALSFTMGFDLSVKEPYCQPCIGDVPGSQLFKRKTTKTAFIISKGQLAMGILSKFGIDTEVYASFDFMLQSFMYNGKALFLMIATEGKKRKEEV